MILQPFIHVRFPTK